MSNPNRSQIISAPLFKLKDSESENMYDDFEFGFDKSKYSEYFNDFHVYTAGDWTITSINGPGAKAIADAVGGVLTITTDTAENDGEQLQLKGESFLPAAGKKIYYEARFYIEDVDQTDFFIGLADTDTTLIPGVSEGLYFHSADESTALNFSATNGSVTSSESGLATLLDDTFVKVGFKVTGVSQVEYYVNDVKQGTIKTNIPVAEMRISMGLLAGDAAAAVMGVDYIRGIQER